MKKLIMYSTLVADCHDPEWRGKLDGMKSAGIDAVSAVLTIRREKFPCEYPFLATKGQNGQPGATYDLTKPNPRFWAHYRSVVKHCNSIGMGLVVSILNHPSARHGEKLCYGPSWGTSAIDKPNDYWQEVYRRLITWTAREMDGCKLAGILPVLEGARCEVDVAVKTFYEDASDKSPHWITNTGAAGMLNSPHLHNTSAIIKAKGGVMVSTDGWYTETPADIRKYVPARRAKGDPAIETWINGLTAGYYNLNAQGERVGGKQPYGKRVRPTLALLARGEAGRWIKEFGRA